MGSVPGALPSGPPELFVRSVVDLAGRSGFALRWTGAMAEQGWLLAWALGALGTVDLPGIASIIDLALPGDGVLTYLWRDDGEQEAAAWVSLR